MSRVAKAPVTYPANVSVTIADGSITIKGPKETLTQQINKLVSITDKKESKQLEIAPVSNDPKAWTQAGTARSLINNMVHGVTEGFTKTLELVGVGFRAQAKDKIITLSLGFSHPINYELPAGVNAETPSNTTILLKGANKQIVGQVAAEIREFRPPEPYKGKGVRYAGEEIARKEAKKK